MFIFFLFPACAPEIIYAYDTGTDVDQVVDTGTPPSGDNVPDADNTAGSGGGSSDDDDSTSIWCYDGDDDGYGDASNTVSATNGADGFVADCTDCDDDDSTIHSGCTDVDTGTGDTGTGDTGTGDTGTASTWTWYQDYDGDGYGNASASEVTSSSSAPTGYVSNSSDCNDVNAAINPGKTEVTGDGLDNDCNALTSDTASSSSSLSRQVCVTASTSAWQLAMMDSGEATHTNWVTESGGTAVVVSPILSGSKGSTGCVTVTITGAGTMLKFNGYGSDSELWGKYLVGSTGSGTYASTSGTKSSEVKITVDGEATTFLNDDLVWTD